MSVDLPTLRTAIPGPRSLERVNTLARLECPAITSRRARRAELHGGSYDPIVWQSAAGSYVTDIDGNTYVDLTAGFGALPLGHAHPSFTRALHEQSASLSHALGDVYPSATKIQLLERLATLAPWPDAQAIVCVTGADAVEAALKTATLATGRSGFVAFEGGYHGLSYGTAGVCGLNEKFRTPFTAQLNPNVWFAPYGELEALQTIFKTHGDSIGAIVLERVLGRGGGYALAEEVEQKIVDIAHAHGALVIVDEIFTGLGRIGQTLDAHADILCIGKALGGGLPISACLASKSLMSAWGAPGQEALHTSTFAGHPLACATAIATLDTLEELSLAERSLSLGAELGAQLTATLANTLVVKEVRASGLLLNVEFQRGQHAVRAQRALLERGWLALLAGQHGNILQITPALTIDSELLTAFGAEVSLVARGLT